MSYVCIDGGQTRTSVSVLDGNGAYASSWEADSLTTPSKPGALEGLRAVVLGICEELDRRLEDPRSTISFPRAMCFSLTGYLQGDDRIPVLVEEGVREILPGIERVHTVPDYVGNWAAATRGEPGVVVISGGGAVAYGRNQDGISLRVGGWGHLLGDEGSGYWIGLEAIKAALGSWSGVSGETPLEREILERFRSSTDLDLINEIYSSGTSDADIARLAPLVDSHARSGDGISAEILDRAARHLAKIAASALDDLGTLPVYLSGGVFAAARMQERFEGALLDLGHDSTVTTVAADPQEGIFLIARDSLV